jgi:hypothetical protein
LPDEQRIATLLAFVRTLEASANDDVLDLFDVVTKLRCGDAIDRRNQLNYRDALAKDLPIGSGEIEKRASLHRATTPEAARSLWRVKHAEYRLALRVTRRNDDWEAYWPPSANTPRVQTPQL